MYSDWAVNLTHSLFDKEYFVENTVIIAGMLSMKTKFKFEHFVGQ